MTIWERNTVDKTQRKTTRLIGMTFDYRKKCKVTFNIYEYIEK